MLHNELLECVRLGIATVIIPGNDFGVIVTAYRTHEGGSALRRDVPFDSVAAAVRECREELSSDDSSPKEYTVTFESEEPHKWICELTHTLNVDRFGTHAPGTMFVRSVDAAIRNETWHVTACVVPAPCVQTGIYNSREWDFPVGAKIEPPLEMSTVVDKPDRQPQGNNCRCEVVEMSPRGDKPEAKPLLLEGERVLGPPGSKQRIPACCFRNGCEKGGFRCHDRQERIPKIRRSGYC